MKEIKNKVREIAEIAKTCPDNLQVVCFETLLKHYLGSLEQTGQEKTTGMPSTGGTPKETAATTTGTPPTNPVKQDDVKDADLHLKAKRFMEKEDVTLEQINNLFYKEGPDIKPLFDDLKTTRMAESQIRVTLLQCLVAAMLNGEFEASITDVKTECTQRKCLDSSNFTANFRNNGTLFDSAKIDRRTQTLRLSDAGRKELADLIKELQ